MAQAAQAPAPGPVTILLVGASGMIGSRILAEATGANIRAVQLDATDAQAFIALLTPCHKPRYAAAVPATSRLAMRVTCSPW